jgi:hypothetical protein
VEPASKRIVTLAIDLPSHRNHIADGPSGRAGTIGTWLLPESFLSLLIGAAVASLPTKASGARRWR